MYQLLVHYCPLPFKPPSLLHSPPHISRLLTSTKLSSLWYVAASYYLFYMLWCVYDNNTLPIHPVLPFPICVHMSILYTCICSFTVNRLVKYRFSGFHRYALMYYICFSLTSLSITGSRFIYLTRTDSNSFFFISE